MSDQNQRIRKQMYDFSVQDFIGKNPESVFPVSFISTKNVNGTSLRFILDGFVINGGPRKNQTVRPSLVK